MSTAVQSSTPVLHPLFAAILGNVKEQPEQLRRAEYVSRLMKMDWEFEHAARIQRNAGKAELNALYELQAELDPLAELWNRHAKFPYLITRSVKLSATKPDGTYVSQFVRSNLHAVDLSHAFMAKHDLEPGTKVDVQPITGPSAGDIDKGPIT